MKLPYKLPMFSGSLCLHDRFLAWYIVDHACSTINHIEDSVNSSISLVKSVKKFNETSFHLYLGNWMG